LRSSAYPAHETVEFLKDDLDGQLHVELLTGAQTRSSTEITDSVTDQTEAIVGLSRGAEHLWVEKSSAQVL